MKEEKSIVKVEIPVERIANKIFIPASEERVKE
jgi:hypothetical protein